MAPTATTRHQLADQRRNTPIRHRLQFGQYRRRRPPPVLTGGRKFHRRTPAGGVAVVIDQTLRRQRSRQPPTSSPRRSPSGVSSKPATLSVPPVRTASRLIRAQPQASVTLSGTATSSPEYQAALDSVTFSTTSTMLRSRAPSAGRSSDGTHNSNSASSTMAIAVPDPRPSRNISAGPRCTIKSSGIRDHDTATNIATNIGFFARHAYQSRSLPRAARSRFRLRLTSLTNRRLDKIVSGFATSDIAANISIFPRVSPPTPISSRSWCRTIIRVGVNVSELTTERRCHR